MMKMCSWFVLMGLLISGCGELSYKRGASAEDLEITKKSCQSAGDEKSVEKCLEDHGWVVKKLDDIDLFATASVSPDNRNPGIDSSINPPAKSPNIEAGSSHPTSTTNPEASPRPAIAASKPTSAPPAPANPLDVYTVSSWWKVGAGREAMEANTSECVTELGEAHRPNNKTQQVTRGFVICMHGKGWKALREK